MCEPMVPMPSGQGMAQALLSVGSLLIKGPVCQVFGLGSGQTEGKDQYVVLEC